jgi:hypothetical protein
VAPASAVVGAGAPTRDIGSTDLYWGTWGQGLLTDWWETTADLIWPQSVITYGRMRHDPQISGVLKAYVLPILRANWWVDPTGCRDQVVQHVSDDLGVRILGDDTKGAPARRRGVQWGRHLRDAVYNRLVYGHMPFELRYRIDGTQPGDCHLDHLGARMPWTLAQIHLDDQAQITEVVQTTQDKPLPANRLLWYVNEKEGANWAGISMLRPVFGAWLIKHEVMRVHATSMRRFGMGVPTVTAPPGATVGQVTEAQQLAAAMRVGDQSGVGLPQGFKFALEGLTGSVPDALGFLKWIDQVIAKMALAGLVELGQTDNGSRALGETFMDLFMLSLQAVADDLALTATSGQDGMPGIVTDLVDLNWGEDEPAPRLVCSDVGENYEVTAEAIGKLAQYGALSPDPALDEHVRKVWRLPERTTEWEPTSRGIPAPGAPAGPVAVPGETGLPSDAPDVAPAPAPGAQPAKAAPSHPGGTASPAAARGRHTLAAAGQLRRQLTPVEAASGHDPIAVHRDWQSALSALMAAWKDVSRTQRNSLVDQVVEAVQAGKLARLAQLQVDSAPAAQLLAAAMEQLAYTAAQRVISEADSQGITIDPASVKLNAARLAGVADARAALAAAYTAQQASTKALQITQVNPAVQAADPATLPSGKAPGRSALMQQAMDVGDDITVWLGGLSGRPLQDQLGAALMAAQNAGRVAALVQAPGGQYVASEVLDQNTCEPCSDIDGSFFGSLAEAADAYANGGYIGCEGGLRCRGTVVALWGEVPNL